jgi:predicted permease
MWILSALERVGGDVRHAVRGLARRPTWTLVVVSTLALGIGPNTAIFTLIDSMLFKPASWNRDNRLVWVVSLATHSGRMSYADYITYRDRAPTLSGVLAFGGSGVSVGSAHPQRVLSGFVSGNYFDVLRLRPVVGRTFLPDEDAETGGQPVAVLSHAFWTEQFAADPRVVNTVVTINGQPFTIIGVAPPGFTGVAYANDAEHLWLPLAMHGVVMRTGAASPAASTSRWLRVVGRLQDGATAAQAAAEVGVIAQQSLPAGTRSDRERGMRVVPVRGGLNPWEQRELAPVFGLIAIVPLLVLLVACTNVANLLMARNRSRSKELAIRLAIGASRTRLVRLLLTESLVLALPSAVVGFVFSFGVIRLMMRFGNLPTDDLHLLTPDSRALVATTLLAIATTLVFGLAPALTVTKVALLPALKE